MPTPLQYMQFATGVYAASARNYVAPPTGWDRFNWKSDSVLSGFSAGYYFNSLTNEVVISYTGTNDVLDKANWVIGTGLPLPQIYDAVAYYFEVKAAHPTANITFTGHSLGGGLASLMAVFFDKQAIVFDQAPFQLAALSPFVLPAVAAQMILSGYADSAFTTYLASAGLLALTREYNVTQYYVEGEALSFIRYGFNTLLGSDHSIPVGDSNAGPVELHSMALLTALQYSPAFLQAVQKLPDLVSLMLDQDLFAADPIDEIKSDLLRKLLRHQLGIEGAIQPDEMLNRFAADMNKLAQPGGLTMTDGNGGFFSSATNNISKALTAFAMQFYYENSANATDSSKELFAQITGGLLFDMADVSKDFATTLEQSGKDSNLTKVKGFELYFKNYLSQTNNGLNAEERGLINSVLPYMRDWYVQAGAGGMNATDKLNRNAFMLGWAGSKRERNSGLSALNTLL